MRRDANHARLGILIALYPIVPREHIFGLLVGTLAEIRQLHRTTFAFKQRQFQFRFKRLHCAAYRTRLTLQFLAGGVHTARPDDFSTKPPQVQVIGFRHTSCLCFPSSCTALCPSASGSPNNQARKNLSKSDESAAIPRHRSSYTAFTHASRRNRTCEAGTRSSGAQPFPRRYRSRKRNVVRVLPSLNSCICHRFAANAARCRIVPLSSNPTYETVFPAKDRNPTPPRSPGNPHSTRCRPRVLVRLW